MRVKMWDEILAEIAYILMGLMFLVLGQYLVVIIMIAVYIFATKLQNDFKKWALDKHTRGSKDILDKMANIAKEEQNKHKFSIAHNHIFLVSEKLYKQIGEDFYDNMEDIRVLKFRDYTILKFDGVVNDFILFGEIHLIK